MGDGRAGAQDTEMMRLPILGEPQHISRIRPVRDSASFLPSCSLSIDVFVLSHNPMRQTAPEILDAAQNNPARFAGLIRQTCQRHMEAQSDADRERMLLEADPLSIDAQRKVEEAIQQQAILDNLGHALEYSPEFFGRVAMLW